MQLVLPATRSRFLGPAILAAVSVLTLTATLADMPSSTNYRLESFAFTGGRGQSATPPSSTNYTLLASSMGGISDEAATGPNHVLHAGYLVPWASFTTNGRPVILSIWISGGRVYLLWTAVPGATGYHVESTPNVRVGFTIDNTGVRSGQIWNGPIPPASPKFYRVRATSSP